MMPDRKIQLSLTAEEKQRLIQVLQHQPLLWKRAERLLTRTWLKPQSQNGAGDDPSNTGNTPQKIKFPWRRWMMAPVRFYWRKTLHLSSRALLRLGLRKLKTSLM